MREPRRRVFLSFRGEDVDLVNLFRAQARREDSELDFIDFSLQVPFRSENAQYIQRGIRARIRACSVTVVLVGETTYQSEWVDWEVRESVRLGKGVVAVSLKRDPTIPVPQALLDHGVRVIPRDHSLINRAIQEAAQNRRSSS
ncbi:MAG: TIR domain-containing protein [bacterium]